METDGNGLKSCFKVTLFIETFIFIIKNYNKYLSKGSLKMLNYKTFILVTTLSP